MSQLTYEHDKQFIRSAVTLNSVNKAELHRHYNEIYDELRKREDEDVNGYWVGWIPTSEQMPKAEEEVFIRTKSGTVTTAMYEDGKISKEESMWNWYDLDFDYDEENDQYMIPEGWWEYRHFNPDDVYNNPVDEEVTHWMPKPTLPVAEGGKS